MTTEATHRTSHGWKNAAAILALMLIVPFIAAAEDATVQPAADTQGQTTAQPAGSAYAYKRDGLFGCNMTGSYAMSVGAMSAIGGVYVPVNDAAVTLNTGYLVYQQCVLREIIDRQKEAGTASIIKKATNTITSGGPDGTPLYVTNLDARALKISDKVVAYELENNFGDVNTSFQAAVRTAVARKYMSERKNPTRTCQTQANLNDLYQRNQTDNYLTAMFVLADPDCRPYDVAQNKYQDILANVSQQLSDDRTVVDWGRGFTAVTDNASNPYAEKILTPSVVVQETYQSALNAPVDQLNMANDIGQINSPLMNGISTQAISDINGLSGLLQPQNGQPSYLDRMTAEASAGLRDGALNAAIQTLNAVRQVEGGFHDAKSAVADALLNTITQLRGYENQCWNLIIPKAKDYALNYPCNGKSTAIDPLTGQPACTVQPFELKIATSSAFSQQVIDSQIAPIATQVAGDVKSSEKALQALDSLIAGVTNTNSLTAQRLAMEQLDALTAHKPPVLHNQYDLTAAQKQQQDSQTALQSLLNDTKTAWADSTDPNIGWCNVNSASIIQMWAEKWRKK